MGWGGPVSAVPPARAAAAASRGHPLLPPDCPTRLGPHPAPWPSRAQKVVPSVVPGIILGILCLLGFIFFSLWM